MHDLDEFNYASIVKIEDWPNYDKTNWNSFI
jgi:hypothetical protein